MLFNKKKRSFLFTPDLSQFGAREFSGSTDAKGGGGGGKVDESF
jgi:hypothetical protein